MNMKLEILRRYFQSLSKEQKIAYLQALSPKDATFFYKHPELFLFDKQVIPDGNWRYALLRCGRRFGKSVSGSAWIASKVINGAKSLGLCGEDYSAVLQVMVKNILTWFPKDTASYNGQHHKITFTGQYEGAEIYCYSSDKEIKGPSLEYLWCDELANWCDRIPDKVRTRFESVDTAVSVGLHPQTIITTTPRSFPLFFDFQQKIDGGDPNYFIMTGTMFDNPFLSEGYKQKELDKYKHDPLKLKQEMYGELVFEDPSALFQSSWINDSRISDPDNKTRDQKTDLVYFLNMIKNNEISIKTVIISVDPAITNGNLSDETGIIIIMQDFKGECYILHDFTGKHTPDAWAKIVRDYFRHYSKHFKDVRIVAEGNQGGDLVKSNILAADHTLAPYIKLITASKGKLLRAEPVAAKYQRGKVHHVGNFEKLERQMLNYTGNRNQGSPDAMDAMVHAVNEATIVPQYANRDLTIIDGW
jgi:phage terminase large subunit-like protein